MGTASKNFDYSELACRCKCGFDELQLEALQKLQKARDLAGLPFSISSACRCETHNKSEGGVEGSSHLGGWAIDIRVSESTQRFIIVTSLLATGFTRIGISKNFIHVDCDPTKAPNVIWLY